MLNSTELIITNHLSDHIIRDHDLSYLFKGSAARRYALVNKALRKGELIRICRGYYTIATKYQKLALSLYYIANRIIPNSYITAESALSYYNWIPERITAVTSIASFGRNREFDTPLGHFIYRIVPIIPQYFYIGVNSVQINNQLIYIATPLRALMDYVYWHKIKGADSNFFQKSLRIEKENLKKITKQDIKQLQPVYRAKNVTSFLQNLINKIENE